VNGTTYSDDAVAEQAQKDVVTAYNSIAGQLIYTDLTGTDLGGLILDPGVYHFNSSAALTGALILNAQGNPNAVFEFQIGSTLTTATASSVTVINGGQCNVYWQVGSSATLGTGTSFLGNVLADASVTLNTGATIVHGGAYAISAAVTLDDNAITTCAFAAATPEPAPVCALGVGILGFGLLRRRSRINR
jgi:type VI secretion system secreted protein VgrG